MEIERREQLVHALHVAQAGVEFGEHEQAAAHLLRGAGARCAPGAAPGLGARGRAARESLLRARARSATPAPSKAEIHARMTRADFRHHNRPAGRCGPAAAVGEPVWAPVMQGRWRAARRRRAAPRGA